MKKWRKTGGAGSKTTLHYVSLYIPKSLPSPLCSRRAQSCYLSIKHICKSSSIPLLLSEQTSNGLSDERRIKAKARPQDSALTLGSKRKHHSARLDPSHGWDTMNNSVTQEFNSREDFLEQSKGSVCGSCREGVTKSTWMGPKGRSLTFAHLQAEKCDLPPSLTSSPITPSQLTFTLTSTELAALRRYLNLSHLTTLAHPWSLLPGRHSSHHPIPGARGTHPNNFSVPSKPISTLCELLDASSPESPGSCHMVLSMFHTVLYLCMCLPPTRPNYIYMEQKLDISSP